MSHGVRMWGADGVLQFDTGTATWRIVLSVVVSFSNGAQTTQQFSVPGCAPANAVAMVIPIGVPLEADRQLETEIGDGVAYVRNFIKGFAGTQASSTTMRFIVMRWY